MSEDKLHVRRQVKLKWISTPMPPLRASPRFHNTLGYKMIIYTYVCKRVCKNSSQLETRTTPQISATSKIGRGGLSRVRMRMGVGNNMYLLYIVNMCSHDGQIRHCRWRESLFPENFKYPYQRCTRVSCDSHDVCIGVKLLSMCGYLM